MLFLSFKFHLPEMLRQSLLNGMPSQPKNQPSMRASRVSSGQKVAHKRLLLKILVASINQPTTSSTWKCFGSTQMIFKGSSFDGVLLGFQTVQGD